MKNHFVKKALAGMLALLMAVPSSVMPAKATETAVGREYVSESTTRQHINFNSDWKFYLGDIENGQAPELDDSLWTDIALPHSFSIPYNMESSFYVGYGWYRKDLAIDGSLEGKQVALEFEAAFQVAEVYVNGEAVGVHEGGYTGFEYDITDYLTEGNNQIAVRVNNIWQHDLAPRSGDHQFSGGIYRDVYLNITDDVHVEWYGTFVTTPDLINPDFHESAVNVSDSYPSNEEIMACIENRESNVRVETEVTNASAEPKTIRVKQQVVDEDQVIIAEFTSEEQTVAAGENAFFDAVSERIQNIKLWDTENPNLYTVYTTVYSDDAAVDTFESTFGFRWAQYRDDGFYLNGEYTLLNGANVHQDHGGWGDAVTNSGFDRDVAMVKEAGMNFIRGSHYPHDPAFADACDEQGMLFWSENCFWGMGGCAGKDDDPNMTARDWSKDAYPQNPEDEEAFEASCMQTLAEMIRINRNHPSIINWSMGNEVFFTSDATQQKAKDLVNEMRNLSHLLDPTRKAGMGGVQRQNYDTLEICDIAGYNGDGAKITNTWMPNIVAEYGSKTADRPGEYRPFYDHLAASGTTDQFQLKENSAGLSLWCAFHHGTIGGSGLAKMGIIDYYRLPLNTWYWYRENFTGVAPEQSIDGKAVKLSLTASSETMTNDGTEDVHLIVTLQDEDGNWVDEVKKVTLEVVDGPGVFPTGKEYTFLPNSTILDGKAAIEFRSYYPGETVIRATAPGLESAEIRLTTVDVRETVTEEPESFYVMPEIDSTAKIEDPLLYATSNVAVGRPIFPSSGDDTRTLAVDGDLSTSWVAGNAGSGEYWMSDLEFTQYLYKLRFDFETEPYPYKVEVAMDKNSTEWTTIAEYTKETIADRPYEESLDGIEARHVKITFTEVPEGEYAFLSECEVYGVTSAQAPQYEAEWAYLSDLEPVSESTGWGEIGKDLSCEGNPISVGGVEYEKGLGFHADSSIVYKLDGKYTRFQAYAGIDDEVGTNVGDAIFQVYADGTLIYEKNLFTGDSDFVDLSVHEVDELKLVTATNGAASNDHTDWADAKVLGAIRETNVQGSGFKATFTSNTQKLHANETFRGVLGLENVSSETNGYTAALSLYDAEGTLIDMTVVNDYLSKGKETVQNLSMEIPNGFEKGELHVNVWNAENLELIAKTVIVSAGGDTDTDTDADTAKYPGETVDGFFELVERAEMSDYTEESRSAVSEAMLDAAKKYAAGKAGSEEYEDACEVLQAAMDELEKKPQEKPELTFEDVSEKDYFYQAVCWAVEEKVTSGVTPTAFMPYNNCTRADIVTFLYRAMKGQVTSKDCVFTDVNPSEYYYDAMLWAVEEGITTGMTATTFQPYALCTREQIVTFLWRAMGSESVSAENTFTDVSEGEWYYEAVLWAVEKGITTGQTPTVFGTLQPCYRADSVLFLQRALK